MLKVTLKGLLAHKFRLLLTTLAVVTGVGFVAGSFILTDSVRAQFDQLFVDINQGIDLQVRSGEQAGAPAGTRPIDESILPTIQGVTGVKNATGGVAGAPAQLIGRDGKAVSGQNGAPSLGVTWQHDEPTSSVISVTGGPPQSDNQVALDVDVANRGNAATGDTVTVVTPMGARQYTVSGTFSFGADNALAGATLVAFTVPEAQQIFGLEGKLNTIDVQIDAGASIDQVDRDIAAVLPDGVEVVPQSQVVADAKAGIGGIVDIFGNVLLGFAGVTLFVSAFLIVNTFTIVVGQRVKELALLRAMGASARQVGWSVIGEAVGVGVVASIVGVGFGIVVAAGMNALLSSTGFGASNTSLVISPRSILVAVFVGLIVTVASAISPAIKATRVPPIAAMRDDFTLVGMSTRVRAIIGTVLVVVGGALIGFALIAKPDTVVLLIAMIAGALSVFLGVALLSPLVAGPVARAIGAPLGLFKVAGKLATDNASRNPQRTASTASALMIGLALISMATVVGTSLKESFADTINGGVLSDWVITSGPAGFTPEVATELKALPQLTSVSPARSVQGQVNGNTKGFIGLDYDAIEQLFRINLVDGSLNANSRGLLVQSGPAHDLGLSVGDTVDVTFVDTGTQKVPVVGIYDDGSVIGNWILDNQTVTENTTTQIDQFVAMLSAPGVSADEARAAIEPIITPYPDLKLQTRAEYTAAQIAQLDQLLAVVNVFLLLAVVIAFIGITNTLALSVFERTKELGLLRAVGMSRRQVRRMVRLEAVIVSVFGALLGVIVGVIFGLVIAVSLPDDVLTKLSVPVAALVQFVVLAGLVGVLAAVIPAFRAGRLKVLDAISSE